MRIKRARFTVVSTVLALSGVGAAVNQAVAASPQPAPGGATIVSNHTGSDAVAGCSASTITSIQTAIDAASSGDTIYVCEGTYNESLTINKTLTLDGAQFGNDARGRTAQPETIVNATNGIVYQTGATSGTISGFTLQGFTGPYGLIMASQVGAGWTFTDNVIDASNGAIYMNTNHQKNPPASTVSNNSFVQSIPSAATSGFYGTAVALWGDTASNVTIANNDLVNLSGVNAGINSTQSSSCPTTVDSTSFGNNDTISGNHFIDSGDAFTGGAEGSSGNVEENFLALFCTTNAKILNNTIEITDHNDANGVTPLYIGGGDWSTTIKGNTLTGHGESESSGVGLNSDFYPAGTGIAVTGNTISGFVNGIKVRDGVVQPAPAGNPVSYFTIGGNKITGSTNDGIDISNGLYGTIYNNNVSGSTTFDCEDDTTNGTGTAGTDNTWTGNVGAVASPATICNPAPSAVLYRVNAGGSSVSGSPSWSTDTAGSPSKYNNAKSSGNNHVYSTSATINTSQAGAAPATIFKTHRFVVSGGSDMIWNFPVTAGKLITVNLYFAEIWSPCFHEGCRTFDVSIGGKKVLDDFDVYAAAGDHGNWGVMRSFNLTVPKTGTVTISFGRGVQNPMVSGIEIVTN